ncbi:YceI family protein [Mucilaginibacter ginkgonis]|uniref:YceI family protein n=1 Tax=Mucilaginibacter ginkgonis TaxID=2682091 RepID=A0A6I4I291_9SPHI|nr:YceI family protein [Mucilaginibacter ginkgonis]QQL50814.1 YceI family protein [Mucilaginibacter ginkgonis]
MKKITLIAAFVLGSMALFAQTAWKNDKAHSHLKFTITHLAVSDVDGLFKDFDATIVSAKPDFSDAKFTLTAKVASINTENSMRDNHLQSAEFFDAANNPNITFVSTGLKKVAAGKYKLMGNLTMHGITKPVTFDLWYRGTITNPMSKSDDAGFKISGTVKRSDFKLGDKYPNAVISDEVVIAADGEFAKS